MKVARKMSEELKVMKGCRLFRRVCVCDAHERWNSAVVHVKLRRSETAVNYGRTGLNVKWIDASAEHVLALFKLKIRDISFHSFCRMYLSAN